MVPVADGDGGEDFAEGPGVPVVDVDGQNGSEDPKSYARENTEVEKVVNGNEWIGVTELLDF